MGTWKSRGLRGSTLEDMINHTNEIYREKKLALIQKIPTPITPITIEKSTRHITLAYFDQKSTVDYIGAVQGIPVCFDAKECAVKTFPLQNVHEHQIQFMKEFEEQGGIAFIILHFTALDEMYYMPFRDLITRRIIRDREGDNVSEEVLADYANPDSQNYQEMVEEIRKHLNFTTLKFHRLDDLVKSIGLPKECLCTYCWDGQE